MSGPVPAIGFVPKPKTHEHFLMLYFVFWNKVGQVLRIRPERKFCKLGDLSNDNGWPHAKLVERLESKRKVKSSAFYAKKKTGKIALQKAMASVKLGKETNFESPEQ